MVTSLFSTVYADAPAEESNVEEPKVEETPEASEEAVEEEEEEPEDVCEPPMPSWFAALDVDRRGPFRSTHRYERDARTVLYAPLIRSTICIVKRRSITAKVSRGRIVLKSCKLPPIHYPKPVAEILFLQM